MLSHSRRAALAFLALAIGASPALADSPRQERFDARATAFAAAKQNIPVGRYTLPPGARKETFRFGPMKIEPGQNLIDIDIQDLDHRPKENGWIVGFRPGLVYADGSNPSVKVVHLHHAVWLVGESFEQLKPTFAAGEEKTYFHAPSGFGWRYTTDQTWMLNHMIHDLTSKPQEVYLTYEMWFIPDSAPEAAGITRIDTQWMDVQAIKPYPVFDAERGSGTKGRLVYPDQDPDAYAEDGVVRNKWVADHDGTMVSTAGHLHPGGLWTDLKITRDGVTKRIFRSRANYYEPTGPVSWDVSMSATTDNWKVDFKRGDVIETTATYDTRRASWYEVMGIMVVGVTQHPVAGGVDPFSGKVDQTDQLTHGRLKENIDTAVGLPTGLTNPVSRASGPQRDRVTIRNFRFSQGDLSAAGRKGRPPVVAQGSQLTFVNQDDPLAIRFHTVTACKAPCNKSVGIGYPLANGPFGFDSGELGFGPTISTSLYDAGGGATTVPMTAAKNVPTAKENCDGVPGLAKAISNGCVGTTIFKTPKTLTPGTYAYFCRVHPFMRGAFRVVKDKKRSA